MIGVANFNGKFKGIPLSAKQINDNEIIINVDNKLISFKKGKKNSVKKELQTIFNKILTKQYKDLDDKYLELDAKKDNIKINKFVDTLDLEFKNVKSMPVKKATTKKKVAPKKTVTKKKVAPKKAPAKNIVKVVKQKGTSNKKYDKMRQALPPGVRISKVTGKPYKEVRTNRSDKGVLLGINEDFFDTTVIKDIDDLRKQYFKLAQKYHPDKGGTTSQMQQLNAEHKRLLDKLLKGSKLSEEDQKNEIDIDDAMKIIIDNIINIQNINIEVVGKWLWVSSDTFGFTTPTYNALNSAGLKYIKKQGKPYMIYAGVQSTSRGKMSKSDIDAKYGKTTFTPKKPNSINGVITNKTKLLSALKKLKKALDNRPV